MWPARSLALSSSFTTSSIGSRLWALELVIGAERDRRDVQPRDVRERRAILADALQRAIVARQERGDPVRDRVVGLYFHDRPIGRRKAVVLGRLVDPQRVGAAAQVGVERDP